MQAMYRDIETILTRYESAFDNTIQNELEERGLGKEKKKQKPDVPVRWKLVNGVVQNLILVFGKGMS